MGLTGGCHCGAIRSRGGPGAPSRAVPLPRLPAPCRRADGRLDHVQGARRHGDRGHAQGLSVVRARPTALLSGLRHRPVLRQRTDAARHYRCAERHLRRPRSHPGATAHPGCGTHRLDEAPHELPEHGNFRPRNKRGAQDGLRTCPRGRLMAERRPDLRPRQPRYQRCRSRRKLASAGRAPTSKPAAMGDTARWQDNGPMR